jgi:hypothetical protein
MNLKRCTCRACRHGLHRGANCAQSQIVRKIVKGARHRVKQYLSKAAKRGDVWIEVPESISIGYTD